VDGALLEDVSITNITMRDITDVPLFLRLGSRMRGPEGISVGRFRRVIISDIVVSNCSSRQAAIITGIPGHYIEEDLKLSNIHVLHQGGGTTEDAKIEPPELENAYPEPNRFGPMPAHGFYIRHVKDIELRDVDIKYMKDDLRPAFFLDDVRAAYFARIKAAHAPDVSSFVLRNVEDFRIRDSMPVPDTHLDNVKEKTL